MIEAASIELFSCTRRNVRLTRAGCARLWEAAQLRRPAPWEGLSFCRTCVIGAANAGKPVEHSAAGEFLRGICARCTRPAERLIFGRWCPSCDARHREALRGRNAKGGRPRLCARLHPEAVAVIDSGAARVVRGESVIGPVEVMVNAARGTRGAIAFGMPGAIFVRPELGGAASCSR